MDDRTVNEWVARLDARCEYERVVSVDVTFDKWTFPGLAIMSCFDDPPPYTTNIGLLWPVVEQVNAKGTDRPVVGMPVQQVDAMWLVSYRLGIGGWLEVRADTATRALARAVAEIARRTVGEGA